jgi:hypothetical protein
MSTSASPLRPSTAITSITFSSYATLCVCYADMLSFTAYHTNAQHTSIAHLEIQLSYSVHATMLHFAFRTTPALVEITKCVNVCYIVLDCSVTLRYDTFLLILL